MMLHGKGGGELCLGSVVLPLRHGDDASWLRGGGGAVPGVCVLPLRHGDDASW